MLTNAATWTPHDTRLVVWSIAAVFGIVLLITRFKVHPFIALLAGAGVVGGGSGLPLVDVVKSVEAGFGATLAGTGVLIGLGAMLGKLLADSGGADRVVETILARAGARRLPWAMALVAMILGLPLFFEVGVVLLVPIIVTMARRANTSLVRVGIPALAGLSVMHGLVPPHPGPLIAVRGLGADVGRTMAFGLLVAVPTVIVAGPLYGAFVGRYVAPAPPEAFAEAAAPATAAASRATSPSFATTVGTVLLPAVLMLGRTLVELLLPVTSRTRAVIAFVGEPLVAMLAAVLCASFTFGYLRGSTRAEVARALSSSLPPIAAILLVIGGGGAFKQVLVAGGIADAIGKAAVASGISPLLLGWSMSVGIRLATGSATVATVTASGLMAPLVAHLHGADASLIALAIGAGSFFFSHVNDAGFWLIKEYFGMSVGQTFATWSAMETVVSVVAVAILLLLHAFVGAP